MFFLSTKDPEGILKIKELLKNKEEVEIKYLSAGKYSVKANAKSPKEADRKTQEFLESISSEAKKQKIEIKEIPSEKKR